jgi:hypothetical protein
LTWQGISLVSEAQGPYRADVDFKRPPGLFQLYLTLTTRLNTHIAILSVLILIFPLPKKSAINGPAEPKRPESGATASFDEIARDYRKAEA